MLLVVSGNSANWGKLCTAPRRQKKCKEQFSLMEKLFFPSAIQGHVIARKNEHQKWLLFQMKELYVFFFLFLKLLGHKLMAVAWIKYLKKHVKIHSQSRHFTGVDRLRINSYWFPFGLKNQNFLPVSIYVALNYVFNLFVL